MKIFNEITEAWNRAKTEVDRPMECAFDYFGEGYLAAHLSLNVEIQRLNALLVAAARVRQELEKESNQGWNSYHTLRLQVARGKFGDKLKNEVFTADHAADQTGNRSFIHDLNTASAMCACHADLVEALKRCENRFSLAAYDNEDQEDRNETLAQARAAIAKATA